MKTIFLKCLAMFLLSGVLVAQNITSGDISGKVTDPSGAVVPSATVTVKNLGTNETRSVTANNAGVYRVAQLSPGEYSVTATTNGMTAPTYKAAVAVGQVQVVNVTVKPQATTEVVEVSGAAPLVNNESPNLSTTFTQQQLELLPTPGGDISTIPFTAPGVVMSTGGGFGSFSSFGLPGTANLFTTNGNDNMDPFLNLNNSGASNLTLGGSEVQEATVVQNGYTAQYGRQAGAQVNFVTKSGSNAFHGAAQYLWNGAVLNANDWFNNNTGTPRGRANSNQWNDSIGGPIKKDKLFFFYANEGIRYLLPSSGTVAVPSPQFQAYTLANVPAAAVPFYTKMFSFYNNAPGISRAVPVTTGAGPQQDSSGALGCGSFSAVSGTQIFGTNTPCAVAFNTNVTNKNTEWLQVGRVDWNVNDQQKVFFRYKEDHGLQPTFTSPLNPIFNTQSNQPQWEGNFNHNWVVNPSTVNSFTASGFYYSAIFAPVDLNASISALPEYVRFFDGGTNASNGTAGGLDPVGLNFAAFPQGRRVAQYAFLDDVSITKGVHALKFGVNFRRDNVADIGPQTNKLAGRYTIFDLTDFANGTISAGSGTNFIQKFDNFDTANISLYSLGLYIQDEWAVKSNLKLTFALRADNNENPKCRGNCFARLNSSFPTLTKGIGIPYNTSITTGLNTAFADVEKVVWQPRFGFNYSPFGWQNTVLRGGIGVFGDLFPAFLTASMFNNSPSVFTPTLRTGNIDVGGAGSAVAIAASTAAAYQNGFASGATRAGLQTALAPVPFTEPNYFSVPDKVLSPKYLEWNFEIQQGIGKKNVVEVNYVGNHGYDGFIRNTNANAWLRTNGAVGATFTGAGIPTGTTAAPGAPDPRFRIVTAFSNSGVSNYDGLLTTFRRSMSYGFQGEISYAWSHALDEVSNGGTTLVFNPADSLAGQIDPNNLRHLNYSNADYDIRHSLTGDFSWQLPYKFENPALQAVLGGWSFSGKAFVRSGTPFSVINSALPGRISNAIGGPVLAQVTNPGLIRTCLGPSDPCFSTSDFATTGTQSVFGNIPRNSFRGPHYTDADLAIYKQVLAIERVTMKIGANMYNVFNHPNFASPSHDVATSAGVIGSTVTPPSSPYGSAQGSAVSGRVIQLTARISF